MIVFNKPPFVGTEADFVNEAIMSNKICGDGSFTKMTSELMESKFLSPKVLMTTSCTHALEMAAILSEIKEGDEVIMPSYTFVSTANAFVLRGAKIKFIDIRPDTMNMDESLIEAAITERTKVIVPVHYAGVACEMDKIMEIAKRYNLFVVEDAAQGVMSTYKGKYLGTIGDFGCYSFHETKNYTMGEGGALLIGNIDYIEAAEIVREKGTDRSKFFRGQVDKYSWVSPGSSYLPSELNVAYLYPQMLEAEKVNNARLNIWQQYYAKLNRLQIDGKIELPIVPDYCNHNGHMFYIKTKNLTERTDLIEYLKTHGVMAVFHYIPLHSAKAGLIYGEFIGEDKYTTKESERLLRLPLFYGLQIKQVDYIVKLIFDFYNVHYPTL